MGALSGRQFESRGMLDDMPTWLQPTSPAILIIIVALLLATLGWTLVWLPTHRHPRRHHAIGQQSIAVLVSIALSLMLAFVVLNQQNSWFTTWSSMGGVGDLSHSETVGDTTPTSQDPIAWQTGTPADLQADPRSNPAFGEQSWVDPAPEGQYLTVSIPGPASGHTSSALVWLPPSYLDHPERFYPVLIGFPGLPGSINAVADGLHPDELITSLSSQGQLRESIVVIPDVFPDNVDTECVDASDGSILMETFVTRDVVGWIRTNLRADSDRAGWTTIGYSAGGFCSSMLTMRHPDIFGSSINMSGYFVAGFEGPKLREDGDTTYDLTVLAQTDPPDVDLWFYAAKDDQMAYEAWQSFNSVVQPPTSLTTELVESGGHTTQVWAAGLASGLKWLGQTQPHFAWQAA